MKDFRVAYCILRGKDILNFGAICCMDSSTSWPLFPKEVSCGAH